MDYFTYGLNILINKYFGLKKIQLQWNSFQAYNFPWTAQGLNLL